MRRSSLLLLLWCLALTWAAPASPAATKTGTTRAPTATTGAPAATTTSTAPAAETAPATATAAVPTTATTTPATTTPATAVPPTATTPPTATAPPTGTAPAVSAAPGTATVAGDSGHDTTAVVLVAVAGSLLVLAVLLWALSRWLVWEPEWLLRQRHATAEAGWRASAAWAEFRDWLRLGR